MLAIGSRTAFKLSGPLVARALHYIPLSGDGHLLNTSTLTGEFYIHSNSRLLHVARNSFSYNSFKLSCPLVARPSQYIPWSGEGHLLNIITLTGEFHLQDACVQVATPGWWNVCALVCRSAFHAHTPGRIGLFTMTHVV